MADLTGIEFKIPAQEYIDKLESRLRKSKQKDERIAALERKNKNLHATIRNLEDIVRDQRLKLDALHWVWCSGGCNSGMHRYTRDGEPLKWDDPRGVDVTEEMVRIAERNTQRMRQHLVNRAFSEQFQNDPEFRARWYEEHAEELKALEESVKAHNDEYGY